MNGLTNKYLESLSNLFFKNIGKKKFLGVFPSDVLPETRRKEFAVIFNLSKHNELGSHFIAIVKKVNEIIYFDSFGEKCYVPTIKSFIQKFGLPITFNTKKIQDDRSNFCGYFCFHFLYHCFYLNKSLLSYVKIFPTRELKQNDNLLLSCILRIINKHNNK